jgi:hypothetical protein
VSNARNELDRIASALERIAAALERPEAVPPASATGKRKRARPQYNPPRLVPVDDLSRVRANKALRRAGLGHLLIEGDR